MYRSLAHELDEKTSLYFHSYGVRNMARLQSCRFTRNALLTDSRPRMWCSPLIVLDDWPVFDHKECFCCQSHDWLSIAMSIVLSIMMTVVMMMMAIIAVILCSRLWWANDGISKATDNLEWKKCCHNSNQNDRQSHKKLIQLFYYIWAEISHKNLLDQNNNRN